MQIGPFGSIHKRSTVWTFTQRFNKAEATMNLDSSVKAGEKSPMRAMAKRISADAGNDAGPPLLHDEKPVETSNSFGWVALADSALKIWDDSERKSRGHRIASENSKGRDRD